MKRRFAAAASALLYSSLCFGARVDQIVPLDRNGSNFDIDAAPNGDLHVAFRGGGPTGPASSFHDICYTRFTKASNHWENSVVVLDGDALNVSGDIDTNQPAVAFDPVNQGAWVTFSGNVRRENVVNAWRVEPDMSVPGFGQLMGTGPWFPNAPVKEIRAVDIAVANDGRLWGCWIWVNTSTQDTSVNGIYCSNDGNHEERGTGPQGAGEGLSLSIGPNGQPHLVTTFNRNLTNGSWSPRDGIVNAPGPAWSPGPLTFNIPNSAGKISCVDPSNNNTMDCAAVTTSSTFGRVAFQFSMTRSGSVVTLTKATALASYGVDVDPGDFNSENIEYARSAGGAEAITFAQDADLQGGLDLTMLMVKPAGVEWPQGALVDANTDGVHDAIGGSGQTPRQYFSSPGAQVFRVFEGTQGRALIAFVTGETPSVGFSGEDLWITYFVDDAVPQAGLTRGGKAAKITGIAPPVPEVSTLGALLALVAFSVMLTMAMRGSHRVERAA